MSSDNKWMPTFTWNYHTEYVEGKKLLRHFKSINAKYLVQFPEKDMIANAWPESTNKMLGNTFDLNFSGLVLPADEWDLRREYTNYMTSISLEYMILYISAENQFQKADRTWLKFRLGDLYDIEMPIIKTSAHNSIYNWMIWYFFRTFFLWESTLRSLLHEVSNLLEEDSEPFQKLERTRDISKIFKQFVNDYVGIKDDESQKFFDLITATRNTIHNNYFYIPRKHKFDSITYKGRKFEFKEEYPLNFISPQNIRLLVQDCFDLMIKIFESDKIEQFEFIHGAHRMSWYGSN